MSTFTDVLAITGLFALRICLPLAVMVALTYGLKRLDRRWQEEARALRVSPRPVEQPLELPDARPMAPEPTPQPGSQADIPGQQPATDLTGAREPEVADKVKGNARR